MGRLTVRVVSGSNLEAKDLGGTSDPYIIVRCSGQQHKTRVVNRNLNPVWNETFNFNNVDPHSSVVFNVYDHDLVGSNDPMGEAHFQCTQIMQNGMPQQLTLPLQRAKRGMVTVEITAYDFPIQGGYPPQQMGYGMPPQQQMGYPPQQQMGYPPQQMGYGMPPQQGYPPQQMHGGYPPQNMHMQHGGHHGGHHDGKKYKDPHKVKDPHKIKDPHKKKHKDPSKKLMKEMKSGVKDVGKDIFKALF